MKELREDSLTRDAGVGVVHQCTQPRAHVSSQRGYFRAPAPSIATRVHAHFAPWVAAVVCLSACATNGDSDVPPAPVMTYPGEATAETMPSAPIGALVDDGPRYSEQARVARRLKKCMRRLRYTLTSADGEKRRVRKLRGHVEPGDHIEATFRMRRHRDCQDLKVSLVSYTAMEPRWVPKTAHLQQVVDAVTVDAVPGKHRLELRAPECYFQVDLVYGEPIATFDPPQVTYSGQKRLIDADNDGVGPCVCQPGQVTACYTGPVGTLDVGTCKGGTAVCAESGLALGACEGEVLPAAERCDDSDANCNGQPNDAPECALPQPCTVPGSTDECPAGETCDLSPSTEALACRPVLENRAKGEACTAFTQCGTGLTCSGSKFGYQCRSFCNTDADCAEPGARCEDNFFGTRTCTISCNPVSNMGCPANVACDPFMRQTGGREQLTDCVVRSPSPHPEGASCSTSNECGLEATCVFQPEATEGTCRTLCGAGAEASCAEGFICRSFLTPFHWTPEVEVRYCDPAP